MSDRFNNRGQRPPQGEEKSYPERTTADNFRLDLKEEDLPTNTGGMPQRHRDMTTADHYASKQVYYTEKERKKQEKLHRKRNRIKAGKNKRTFAVVWLAMVLLVSLTIASFLISGSNDFFGVDRINLTGSVDVTIPENVTGEQLAKILAENGVVSSEYFFNLFCEVVAESKLQYINGGTYTIDFDKDTDYLAIINMLRTGNANRDTVKITFPEGYNAIEIAELLEENGICTVQEALDAMNESVYGAYSILSSIENEGLRYYILEGYMFPDTYDFYVDDGPEAAIKKMLNNCSSKLDKLQPYIEDSGMSVDEILTLASIIQREAADVTDMYRVSAVLHNRLAEDSDITKLECDSTMYYPYKTFDDLPEDKQDYRSNYDTYSIEGLPAGAICNPGTDAIIAALRPSEEEDYVNCYYFCHAEDGTAYYARTAQEHEENIIKAGLKTEGSGDEAGGETTE